MTWVTPVITWSNGNRFTCDDMNRINGNVNFLDSTADLRTDYTTNDFLTVADWNALTSALNKLIAVTGLQATVQGWDGTAETFNGIEGLIQDLYDRIGLVQKQAPATIYSGDDLYVATPVENYVRGL